MENVTELGLVIAREAVFVTQQLLRAVGAWPRRALRRLAGSIGHARA